MAPIDVPVTLDHLTVGCTWETVAVGDSGAVTYVLTPPEGARRYLKVRLGSKGERLALAKQRLEWLSGRVPVPAVLAYADDAAGEFLVTEEIRGRDCSDDTWHLDPAGVVRHFAQGLRMVHAVDVRDCPFDERLDPSLARAKTNTESRLVNEAELMRRFGGRTAEDLLDVLVTRRHEPEDLVFTHGDYSMPNVVVDDGQVAGFLDVGAAGVADKYRDLATAAKSIVRNVGSQWVEPFLRDYGIAVPDWDKVTYYQLLEEFVNP